eukprot:2438534-Prymnesium_polylepis.1
MSEKDRPRQDATARSALAGTARKALVHRVHPFPPSTPWPCYRLCVIHVESMGGAMRGHGRACMMRAEHSAAGRWPNREACLVEATPRVDGGTAPR